MQDELQQIVERMVAAGESEANIAAVIQNFTPAEPEKPQHPYAVVGRGLLNFVKNNPGAAGAMAAGVAAAPFTGGMSLPGAMATGAATGVGGSLVGRSISDAVKGEQTPFADAASEAGAQGVAGVAGPVVGKGLQMLGSGLYRAGVLPIQQVLGKYGNIVKTGLDNRVMATPGGISKIKGIKADVMGQKAGAIDAAGQSASFSAKGVADVARGQLAGKMEALKDAGEIADDVVFDTPLSRFEARNAGGMSPKQLEAVKHTLDDRLGDAYKKTRMKAPLTPREESRKALSQAAGKGMESVVPGYRDMNRQIMDASGLESALTRRVQGSAGNQGLENALTMAIGPAAVPGRIAMLPPVMTGMGIAANEAGKAISPTGSAVLQALLSLLNNQNDQ
jgi:hypothetical protein